MKLENQVCSLELAKKLKELGVKQESLFWWNKKWLGSSDEDAGEYYVFQGKGHNSTQEYSAFTAAELGELLPCEFPGDSESSMQIFKNTVPGNSKWWVRYVNYDLEIVYKVEFEENEADARAKMLIYLIENKSITI